MLADGQAIDATLSKAERAAKSGDKDMIARVAVLKKCQEQLAKGRAAPEDRLGQGRKTDHRIIRAAEREADSVRRQCG